MVDQMVVSRPNEFCLQLLPLRYQRLLRGWSQQHVVDELSRLFAADGQPDAGLGLTVETVSRWENGRRKPSPLYRRQLCRLYAMNAFELGFC